MESASDVSLLLFYHQDSRKRYVFFGFWSRLVSSFSQTIYQHDAVVSGVTGDNSTQQKGVCRCLFLPWSPYINMLCLPTQHDSAFLTRRTNSVLQTAEGTWIWSAFLFVWALLLCGRQNYRVKTRFIWN